MNETRHRNNRALHAIVLLSIAIVALALRLVYVRLAIVDHPLRGDAIQYFSYALNLVKHHTFSLALPNAQEVRPDSFRDPGYPAFLALVASTLGSGETFYRAVLDLQCVFSTLTVAAFMILGRRWMGIGAAVAIGCLLAIWPHLITECGYMLSETLLGVLVAAALLFLDTALRKGHYGWYVAAGIAFALAGLTNAVVLPFGALLGIVMLVLDESRRKLWMVFALAAILPVGAWGLRGASLSSADSSSDRAMMNLVQGAWPAYHTAYAGQLAGDPQSIATMHDIDAEYEAIHHDRRAGLMALGARLARDPAHTLGWYLSKPAHLWGWNIGIGQGDVYVFPTFNSPLLTSPLWRGLTNLLFLLNPIVMLLAATGALAAFFRADADPGLRIAAFLGVFVTGVFTLLQSDARYSTPYRGIEIAMAVYATVLASCWIKARSGQIRARQTDI
ncbi:ArnT family glycosyltransferase [Luteibacter yeojuensis]